MKKIVSVGMVKNESDIIESYVRYALTYSDNVVIYDADSSDNTIEILEQLMAEANNSITLIRRGPNEIEKKQDEIMNYLVNYAINHLSADVIVPIDADEFLIATDTSCTVREAINHLSSDDCYLCEMRDYVIVDTKSKNNSNEFLPLKYRYYINPKFKENITNKTIIHTEAWNRYKLSLVLGNHNVSCPDNTYHSVSLNNLMFAHYPIRSKNQAISKIVKYYIYSSIDYRFILYGAGVHMLRLYRRLKGNNFNMSDNELSAFSFYGWDNLYELGVETVCLISNPNEIYPNIPIKYQPHEIDLYDTVSQCFLSLVSTYKDINQEYYMAKLLSCVDDFGKQYCYQAYIREPQSKIKSLDCAKLYFRLVGLITSIFRCFNPKIQSILSSGANRIRRKL